MQYVDIKDAIEEQGLRIVIVKQLPSPWGVAAKAMMEFKGLSFVVAHQIPLTENHELLEWAGVNSAPVVAWKDEPPLNRWNDILFLLENQIVFVPVLFSSAHSLIEMAGIKSK